ncbi:MAG: hypothetical protein QGF28_03380 [Candidatus Thalassarchaeaceae archaeon]|jgi:hypothetical protein|nr:hypothetical protein [Euryarchaeota archaeon]MDP7091537.1 hypothetical protein [Candidatus Thalassarchaeaceae archaeon]MDP7257398.1 hypothetical protein [Candidatus Thalassarchaeaceae archaeon]MDP7446230.1 hypothetical protein [Candidatus Thalassarchaeaceae archaeon]MDP7649182.1 hypothetical protein [Candidatus Thalassarchaeaceae archaeon]|tara:strand:- start:2246 stop:2509 length:264 start_codon:yes stop_codon:yes gene_type:complete
MPEDEPSEFIDRVIGNPAFDQMGGYHIFFRRVAIPLLLFCLGLLTYTILDGHLSDRTNLIVSFMVVGLSLGPILNFERYYGHMMSRK